MCGQMKTPDDKQIAFTFCSHPTKRPEMRWTAKLVFPPGSTAETVLPLSLADGRGEPVPDGVFEFAGQRLAVRDGMASIAYADFVRGKHAVALWLHRPGRPPIPGGLTFA